MLGQENIHDNDDPNAQIKFVDKGFMHPNYYYTSKEFDIALVKLNDHFDFNDYVAPVILNDEVIPNGVFCDATGWGAMEEGAILLASTLQKVTLDSQKHHWLTAHLI